MNARSYLAGRMKGLHEDRLSGLRDLLCCARGASVLDIGINHGLIASEFARHGAGLVHGCDFYVRGVKTAREIFSEFPSPSRFEIVDLAKGPAALEAAFGRDYQDRYDIVLFLGVYHQLKEQTSDRVIEALVHHLVDRTGQFLVTRTTRIDEVRTGLADTGLHKVHFSALSSVVNPVEIWRRN
jgi:2-polyprenyl-3-methyl-5-hydroxy-6-metoxy-1,4-benzoquinol methylase